MDKYDVVILGAGPGGLGAAVYCARYNLKTLVIGKLLGGYAAEAHLVENYLGYKSISGIELSQKFKEHAESMGAKIILGVDVISVKKSGKGFEVTSGENKKYACKAIVVALGTQRRKLEVPNEDKFLGKGISYCASCDAPFFRDKIVGVVGGSDAAGTIALMLTEHAKKVYIIYRKEELRAEPITKKRIDQNRKIEIIYKTVVKELKGPNKLESVVLDKEGKTSELRIDGLFIEIGSVPSTVILKELGVEVTEEGYIKVKEDMSTSAPGVFAAGDITTASNCFRQIITAASEGAVAANSIFKYLKSK
ncbi:MAG: FAD-dependent oxidoreductase [Candidatus Aenigmarchaeota archaeon]|nr:FAD-dependent oxidoreductase [Candidatus Aenigmarchaeota archaeon]